MRTNMGGAAAVSIMLALACESTVEVTSDADASVTAADGGRTFIPDNPDNPLIPTPDGGFTTWPKEQPEDAGPAVEPPPIDSAWVEYKTECAFSFFAPEGLEQVKVQPIDSCVVRYDGEGCLYSADFGGFSAPLKESFGDDPNYEASSFKVSGDSDKTGILVTAGPRPDAQAQYIAGARVRTTESVALSFVALCETEEARDLATRVVQTIQLH